ncbi:MAG: glycoside hydrolase family 2 TIM barrel-domain containing protein [Alistipes sp.]|nr:glycoside hydrolase family 2 TIM barrel-domain containing protein [Alistipes sp.]
MKRSILYSLATLFVVAFFAEQLSAQARVARSEFICYDKREDAVNDVRDNIDKYLVFSPELQFEDSGKVRAVYEQVVDVPSSWNDFSAYLHIENVGADYALFVNGEQITAPIDKFTPVEIFVSPYLQQGQNTLAVVVVDEPYMGRIAENLSVPERKQFENCYIFAQRRVGVFDYNVRLLPDAENKYARLKLDVVVDNTFTTDEVLELGYDLYDPTGKLVDYTVNRYTFLGSSRDTVTFEPYSYNSNQFRWSEGNPKLYSAMLYVKRGGVLREYIPMKVGFAKYGYNDKGEILLFDKPLSLKKERYNSAADAKSTEAQIKALKAKGVNCLCPEYPQPKWFYSICDRLGVYVIDSAAIASPSSADNRAIGGTPSNDPDLVDDYLLRVEAMYRRAQNHVSIIAFSLGSAETGNGYNMYKAYELLKSYGDSRAIIFEGADGEWNTDLINE